MTENLPKATHGGVLKIGDIQFPCVVLDDGSRIISGTGFMKGMGMYRSGALSTRRRETPDGAQTPLFLAYKNLKPFINEDLMTVLNTPVEYVPLRSSRPQRGIKAEAIPKICEVWLRARDEKILKGTQLAIAVKCDVIIRALAHVGIIALVDEATGYQYDRDRQALHKILEAYIAKELLPWAKRFPDEFYKELFRLRGWPYSPPSPRKPLYVGKLTNQLVYEQLPAGVLDELRTKNPKDEKGRRKHKHHQFLTEDIGNPHLERHIASVTTLMRAAANWRTFERLFARAFSKEPVQTEIFSEDNDISDT